MTPPDEVTRRYLAALHGIQSAVAFEMEAGGTLAEPKHLRVGVDSAFVTDRAVMQLLLKKQIITEEEYAGALADAAEAELAERTRYLRTTTGIAGLTFE